MIRRKKIFLIVLSFMLTFIYTNIAASTPKSIIYNGRRFIKYDNGIVYDKSSCLEWFAGIDEDTRLDEAKEWVKNLSLDGGGWRMPTKKELKSLYQQRISKRNITPLIEFTGWWVWSRETEKLSSGWCFLFNDGCNHSCHPDMSSGRRAFAVRYRAGSECIH